MELGGSERSRRGGGWAAAEQMALEDDRAHKALKTQIANQDWTPRNNFAGAGYEAAACGGLWAMGSPTEVMEEIQRMSEGDFLVVCCDNLLHAAATILQFPTSASDWSKQGLWDIMFYL